MTRAVVAGCGHAVPERVMTNAEFESLVDTSDEWIFQRTGIRERRVAGPADTASTLGVTAVQGALNESGYDPADIDMVVCGTVTGDMPFPSTSCLIQRDAGLVNAGAYDVGAACAGFIYALATATAMIETGAIRNAVVVGVDVLTKYIDWSDRSTCVLFGDGAGAVVVEGREDDGRGVLKTVLLSDGSGARHIDYQVGGSLYPIGATGSEGKRAAVSMNGQEVYRFAVHALGDACCRVLEQAGYRADEIDLFVPHQANLRIIESAQSRLGLPDEKVFLNVEKYGNTSGASIPLALSEASAQGRLSQGDLVLTVGFGAGLVWGANLIRW